MVGLLFHTFSIFLMLLIRSLPVPCRRPVDRLSHPRKKEAVSKKTGTIVMLSLFLHKVNKVKTVFSKQKSRICCGRRGDLKILYCFRKNTAFTPFTCSNTTGSFKE
jgi:hypothetical protein